MQVQLDLNLFAFPHSEGRFQRYLTDDSIGALPDGYAAVLLPALQQALGFIADHPRSLVLLAYFNSQMNHGVGRLDLVQPMYRSQNQTAQHQFVFAVNEMFPADALALPNDSTDPAKWTVLTPTAYSWRAKPGTLRLLNLYLYKTDFKFPNQLPSTYYLHRFFTVTALLARAYLKGRAVSVPLASQRLLLNGPRWNVMTDNHPSYWGEFACLDAVPSFAPAADLAEANAQMVLRYIRCADPTLLLEVQDGRWDKLVADSKTMLTRLGRDGYAQQYDLHQYSSWLACNPAAFAPTLRQSWQSSGKLVAPWPL